MKSKFFLILFFVDNEEELTSNIKSNRILKLKGNQFNLKSSLNLDGIENLKLIGSQNSTLSILGQNSTVINLRNSFNVHLENLIIGQSEHQVHIGEQGVVRIEHSNNITISNCKILGAGTFGLITKNVCRLKFNNSSITKCTAVIFELDQSRKIEFKNSTFHDNHLGVSVLGGFTNSTKEVSFTNCQFINNIPNVQGNPVFNFMNNFEKFEEKIVFKKCTFKNNKGYKWYGDKIKLDQCEIDSTDFTGL